MSTPLEDYALLADLQTGPLVSRDGSVDWLCFPRFDSPAVFCALLGDESNGRWKLSAVDGHVVSRRYVPDTFVLETEWRTPTGRVRVTDFLPPSDDHADLVRRVKCLKGTAGWSTICGSASTTARSSRGCAVCSWATNDPGTRTRRGWGIPPPSPTRWARPRNPAVRRRTWKR
ncbi:hypothetical protein GCM10007061_08060 [Kocuria marina]|nr:hypothetical protein GCM10007061_08060 [Kocuria marina]